MCGTAFTLIDETRAHALTATRAGDAVRIPAAALKEALGWTLKPEGLCRAERCMLIGDRAALVTPDGLDLAAFAVTLGRPLALDAGAGAACLGAPADARAAALASLAAPDFTLPDLAGTPHALSDYRGRKVLLVAYASW